MIGAMRPLHLVGVITLFLVLACSGWVEHDVELMEVDRRVADEAGYTMPIDATAIHVRDRSLGKLRSTWFRYELPLEAQDELRAELEDDPAVVAAPDAARPPDWPDIPALGIPAPLWFTPEGTIFRTEAPGGDGVAEAPTARMWALTEEGRVYTWVWSYEGWRFQPDQPTVGDDAR